MEIIKYRSKDKEKEREETSEERHLRHKQRRAARAKTEDGKAAKTPHGKHSSSVKVTPIVMLQQMVTLWTERYYSFRLYIQADLTRSPAAAVMYSNILLNQEQLGNNLSYFYGKSTGNVWIKFLKEDVDLLRSLVSLIREDQGLEEQVMKCNMHTKDLADFVSGINPYLNGHQLRKNWRAFHGHLSQEAQYILTGKWTESSQESQKARVVAVELASLFSVAITTHKKIPCSCGGKEKKSKESESDKSGKEKKKEKSRKSRSRFNDETKPMELSLAAPNKARPVDFSDLMG